MTFDEMASAGNLLGIAMQTSELAATLNEALGWHGTVESAMTEEELLQDWSAAAGESRAAQLLSLAWSARDGELRAEEDHAGLYAGELHSYAKNFAGHSETFHGAAFPAMPLPGQAGALATSLGFDRDDVEISLKTALLLLDTARRRGAATS